MKLLCSFQVNDIQFKSETADADLGMKFLLSVLFFPS